MLTLHQLMVFYYDEFLSSQDFQLIFLLDICEVNFCQYIQENNLTNQIETYTLIEEPITNFSPGIISFFGRTPWAFPKST